MSDRFNQPGTARTEIYQELAQLRLIDPHTHINPHSPASRTLADLLGYHYYTELARSAGMPKKRIEDESIGPKELVERLVGGLGPIENTVQYSWLISICRMFFGFDEDRLHVNNWEALYERSESIMASAQWPDMVLDQSNIEAVFLTNDFDDDLAGFDSDRYIPCLRTDDLVFHLADPVVRERLSACTGVELDGTLSSLRASLRQRFEHFVGRGARACAISLPPAFTPTSVPDGRASTALDAVLRNGLTAQSNDKDALARRVFWTLAELCDEFGLPFDLMIGVNRKVYPDGVFQGQDLYDSRVSLIQYKDLFNAFPDVKFPVSVLASVTNQELVSYSWIFPNVYPNGHWWYSNTPSTITHDLAARLEAVPQTKMIGYYSDAYKLEFVWPKFDMYRKALSGVLADQYVGDRGWSTEKAVELGRQVLKHNTEAIFPRPQRPSVATLDPDGETDGDPGSSDDQNHLGAISTAAAVASVAEGAAVGIEADETFDTAIIEPASAPLEAEEPWLAPESPADESTSESTNEPTFDDDATTWDLGDDDAPTVVETPDIPADAPETLVDEGMPVVQRIDPIPDDDEIGELDLDDVELFDPASTDRGGIGETTDMDDEPLDVGNLLTDDEPLDTRPQIQQLSANTSFSPDDESLKLKSNPTTGEFIFDAFGDDGDNEFVMEPAPDDSAGESDGATDAETTPDSGSESDDDFNLEWLDKDDQP